MADQFIFRNVGLAEGQPSFAQSRLGLDQQGFRLFDVIVLQAQPERHNTFSAPNWR